MLSVFIVTIALGSTLSTVLLNAEVKLAEAALVFALLIGLQFIVTWSSVRVSWVRGVVTGEPRLMLHEGRFPEKALRRDRITKDEIRSAVGRPGIGPLHEVEAVVLETNGSFRVIPRQQDPRLSSLPGVVSDVPLLAEHVEPSRDRAA